MTLTPPTTPTDQPAEAPIALTELTDLHGRIAVVTGAASGIGAACADRLIEAGAVVYRADISNPADDPHPERDTGGDSAHAVDVHLDVTDEAAADALARRVMDTHQRLDIWVNAAGIFPRASILDLALDDWRRVLNVNLDGTLISSQAAARAMVATHTPGVIVNLASTIVERVDGNGVHYRASKAGVVAVTTSLAVELGRHGIRAIAVCPGFTLTEGVAALDPSGLDKYVGRIPLKRAATPDDVATVVLFAVSPMARYVSGTTIMVDGAFLRR